MLNLYLLSQVTRRGYDTYDSAVVDAPDGNTARMTRPDGCKVWHSRGWRPPDCSWSGDTRNWPGPEGVGVTFLGPASSAPPTTRGNGR